MLLPHESRPDDQELRRYLLELLPEEDRERLDLATIVDDEVAGRLRVVEDDLVDGYVRGTLEKATLARFQSHYLSSPLRRENVRVASRFVGAVDRAASRRELERREPGSSAGERSAATGWPRAAGTRWIPSRTTVTSSLAAVAAVLLVATATLLLEGGRLGGRSDSRELSAVAEPAAADAAGSAPAPRRAGTEAATETIALVLLPQTRGLDSIPALVIPPIDSHAALELRLGSIDFPRYQIGLRDPATSQIVWRSSWIEPNAAGDHLSVSVAVPARLLKPQHYALDLAGRTAAGTVAAADSYAFQIVPR